MESVTYTLSGHGVPYTLTKPSPKGDSAVVYARGGRMDLDFEKGMQYEIKLLDEIYARNLTGTAIDVGAHIGNHTLWFAIVCGLNVAAFEPNFRSSMWLDMNVRQNDIESKVKVYHSALGKKLVSGVWDESVPGVLHPKEDEDPEGVVITPLDYFEFEDVSLIKVDVEGYENEVLMGATETIEKWRPVIYAESTTDERVYDVACVLGPLNYRLDHMVRVSSPLGCWVPA